PARPRKQCDRAPPRPPAPPPEAPSSRSPTTRPGPVRSWEPNTASPPYPNVPCSSRPCPPPSALWAPLPPSRNTAPLRPPTPARTCSRSWPSTSKGFAPASRWRLCWNPPIIWARPPRSPIASSPAQQVGPAQRYITATTKKDMMSVDLHHTVSGPPQAPPVLLGGSLG